MSPNARRTRYVLLGLLQDGPKSGYTIKKTIEKSIAHFWTESFGQIYPMLRELSDDGLIERVETDAPESGRGVKRYALTPEGRLELEDWLAEPAQERPPRNELLLKLFFMPRIDPSLAREHLARFRSETEQALERYESIRRWLADTHGEHEAYPFWSMTLLFGLREAEARLAWCDEGLRMLKDDAAR